MRPRRGEVADDRPTNPSADHLDGHHRLEQRRRGAPDGLLHRHGASDLEGDRRGRPRGRAVDQLGRTSTIGAAGRTPPSSAWIPWSTRDARAGSSRRRSCCRRRTGALLGGRRSGSRGQNWPRRGLADGGPTFSTRLRTAPRSHPQGAPTLASRRTHRRSTYDLEVQPPPEMTVCGLLVQGRGGRVLVRQAAWAWASLSPVLPGLGLDEGPITAPEGHPLGDHRVGGVGQRVAGGGRSSGDDVAGRDVDARGGLRIISNRPTRSLRPSWR